MVGATRITGGLCLAAVAALMCGRPAVAEACSGPAHGFTLLSPQSEATEVPLNSVATLIYANPIQPTGTLNLELSADGMGPVEVDVIAEPWSHAWIYRVSVVPRQPLLAEHVYRLRAGETLLTRFTTGQGRDDAPPPPPSLVSVEASSLRLDATCGSYSVQAVDIRVTSEESVTYEVRAGGRLLAEQDQEHGCGQDCGALGGDIVCGESRWSDTAGLRWELEPGSHLLQITARDSAGNESSPLEVEITADCPSGCSAAAHDGGWLAFAAVFALVGFARPRSRRSLHVVACAGLLVACGGDTWSPPDTNGGATQLRIFVPGGGAVLGYVGDATTPVISCPTSWCTALVGYGQQVRLEARPLDGRDFVGWSDEVSDRCAGAGTTCTFTMGRSTRIMGSFGPPSVDWSRSFGREDDLNWVAAVVRRPDHLVVISSTSYGRGATEATGVGSSGNSEWSTFVGEVFGHAAAPALGGTLVGGRAVEPERIGGVEVTAYGGSDGCLVQLDDAGAVTWARTLGGPGEERVVAVGGDATDVVAAGTYDDVFAANALVAASPQEQDVFVLWIDPVGTAVSMVELGSPGEDTVIAMARATDGTVWLLVRSEGSLQWDGGALDGDGLALLRVRGTDGVVLGAERLGGLAVAPAVRGALLTGASGELYVAVTFAGTVELGSVPYESVTDSNVLVARRSAGGTYPWVRHLADADVVSALAQVGDELVVVGHYSGAATFGGAETLTSSAGSESSGSSPDLFILRLDSGDGATIAALHYGAPSSWTSASSVSAVGERTFAIGGTSDAAIDFGLGPLERGERTAFVTQLSTP